MTALIFQLDGAPCEGVDGDTIAAAMVASGHTSCGARHTGAPRGVFCGMGICQDCLVTVNGARGQRACMTELRAGMEVWRQDDRRLAPGTTPVGAQAAELLSAEIAIIGAGPAGLSAAIECASRGGDVVVLDERSSLGGQYFKPRADGFRGGRGLDRQHRRGDALRAKALASGARIKTGQGVWYARRTKSGFEVRSLGAAGGMTLTAKAVILATGAYERPTVVPGWTLPGVITIGAAQTFARRYGVSPGNRILIAGNGPLGLQLAVELQSLGANIVALAERGRPRPGLALLGAMAASPRLVLDGLAYSVAVRRSKTPMLYGYELAEVTGDTCAEGALLRQISTGTTHQIEADLVATGEGFAPQLELARLLGVPIIVEPSTGIPRPDRAEDGTTSVPGLMIAGDAGGLGGAEVALCQGRLSGAAAMEHLGKPTASIRTPLRRAQRFQSALWSLYEAPTRAIPTQETVLCRCESVTYQAALTAIEAGATEPAEVKRHARVGMGRCQGRYCMPQLLRLMGDASLPAPQTPARPVPLGALAFEKPEWGGHRASVLSTRPERSTGPALSVASVDLIVIGAGVTGISAAYFAANAGASVLCLDRGAVNGEASGGNAGSLHLQLLSWDFGGKAVGGGDLQLQTLPLQKDAIALWRDLERRLGADFEMTVTGGMMVAERPEQIAFLEAKAKAESRVGIMTEVIGADRVRQIMPQVSDAVVAAAWCPEEGKINPLAATPALADAARQAGAQIEPYTPVTGIARDAGTYAVQTPRGTVVAPRLLIAAGGWSSQVAQMLGTALPIRGAPLQMIVTAPGPPLIPCLLAHADRHLTMKQTVSGTVLIGGAWPAATGPTGAAEILPDSLEGNIWVATHTVPQIASLEVLRTWAAMNIDIDGAPLIGPVPGLDGVTVAATANGYTLGPLMGREAAAAALSGRVRQDLAPFGLSRFQ